MRTGPANDGSNVNHPRSKSTTTKSGPNSGAPSGAARVVASGPDPFVEDEVPALLAGLGARPRYG